MHDYNISTIDRKTYYYLISLVSFFISSLLIEIVKSLNSKFDIYIIAPSGLLIFALVFFLFDKYIWKWNWLYKLGIMKIPNLNGKWVCIIDSSKDKVSRTIVTSLVIHQTFSKIKFRLQTEKSISVSKMADITMLDPNYFEVRYEYSAEYTASIDAEAIRHYGVTNLHLTFETDGNFSTIINGYYYTEQKRDSHGYFKISKA